MNYRKEIDGLRALAVIPVILFHAGYQSFRGGFVGVDVFFVISGYLITSIILDEIQTGTFSIIRFYERRARRILPALFIVIISCLPFAWLWLLPSDFKNFSLSLIAVPFFSSNILFYLTSGYFDTNAELLPLLHTWSLAVEEQYYVFFPIFLMISWKLGRRWVIGLLLVLGSISFALAEWGSKAHPSITYLLLPTRGWEILIGAFVAFYLFKKETNKIATYADQLLSALGLGLITYAVCVFDKHIPYPGLYALIPTTGAALIILFASDKTLVGRLFGRTELVGIGLISYSAYLWHQPLFAFVRYHSLEEPSKGLFAILTVLSLTLAYLSWKYIETPFRNRNVINRSQVFRGGAIISVMCVALGLIGYFNNGFPSRLKTDQQNVASFISYDTKKLYRVGDCFLKPEQDSTNFSKACNATNTSASSLIWGDSFAASLSVGLRKTLPYVDQYTATTCPPFMGTEISWRPHCKEINQYVLNKIAQIHPQMIYMEANWTLYKDQNINRNIHNTIEYIHKISPSTEITIVGAFPQWFPSLPMYMVKRGITMNKDMFLPSSNLNDVLSIDQNLYTIAKKDHVKFFSAARNSCVENKCQAVTILNNQLTLVSWDYGHLTEGGSILMATKLISQNNTKKLF